MGNHCSYRHCARFFAGVGFDIIAEDKAYLLCKGKENVTLGFHCCSREEFYSLLFRTSCSETFLEAWTAATGWNEKKAYASEEEIFSATGMAFIPAYRREQSTVITAAKQQTLSAPIQPDDITAIIHCHSKWSDGASQLDDMAQAAVDQGYQYMVISDHSKTAFYASGLSEERILAQHRQIDELNEKLAPFKIFKSIESDILNDGSLDYANDVLQSFDVVIGSIHSNLSMTQEKAMMRLMKAIANPYTSILGHMTGRLLLSRNGYPVDHQTIIEACARHNVVIELNAHPRRLDIDWRWIGYALEKGVLISINPDAHAIEGYADCRYGVLVAQKAGLTKKQNLSSFSLAAFEDFVIEQKRKRK